MNIIPNTTKIYGDVQIGKECVVGEYCVIGYPYIKSEISFKSQKVKTLIGNKCIVGSHVVIYDGVRIEEKTRIDDFCRIGENVHIGRNCYLVYGAKIYANASLGENSVIGGYICERARIGKNVRIFGDLVHSHREPHLGWDDVMEKSPIIEDFMFIGFGAKIIGGIRIGKNSYIAAGAIVTKNVPPKSIVSGVNNILPFTKWKGRLKKSQFFNKC